MTITYTAEVATCTKFGCFIKLLARWRGSIYKLVWMDLLLFLFLYYSINLIYRNILGEEAQRTFESVVYYCASYSSLIPLSFVLGFYVNLVMTRWWEQYTTIPWPDSIAVFVSAHVHGQDEGGRVMRRTVMRYVCLCLTIVFTMISPCVKKRFPKLKHLVDAGLLLENEKKIIEAMDSAFPKYPKHWMPIVWAASIITRARNEGRIRDDFAVKTIIDELNQFRGYCGMLMYYDFISIPLVYTQVVTIAVYSFFVCSLLAHQWTTLKKDTYEGFDFSMPVFITMEFFFYMGWLKVAETLINPFGEDDDDFEVNWMIDRNLQVSYLIVDEMHHEHPELVKDQYWDEVYPTELPYEAAAKREHPPASSTAKYDVEDSPTVSTVKASPNTDINQTSILSIRSERFKQAFQRFSQFSEEDITNTIPHCQSTNASLTDVESFQCITSYRPTISSEESMKLKLEHFKEGQQFRLDAVSEEEENELRFETEEEEMEFPIEEAEEEHVESSSLDESESGSDPFERLRLERQQERIQRTNAFLQKYFGYNFKIATLPEKTDLDNKKKSKSPPPLALSTPMDANLGQYIHTGQSDAFIAPNPIQSSASPTASLESNLKRILSTIPMSAEDQRRISSFETIHQLPQDARMSVDLNPSVTKSGDSCGPTSVPIESNLKTILNTLPITEPNSSAAQQIADLNSGAGISAPSQSSQTLRQTPREFVNTSLNIEPSDSAAYGPLQHLVERSSVVEMMASSTQVPLHTRTTGTQVQMNIENRFQQDLVSVQFTQATTWRDATVSPMASIVSLSTAGSSEVGDWEVVAVDSSPSETEGH